MTVVVWIIVGIILTGAAAANIVWRLRRATGPDNGWVSAHWVAEHRASEQGDRLR
jgi:hypothetical protein